MDFKVGALGGGAEPREVFDVIVIGSGPAGLVAALYTSRAQLNTLVVTGGQIGGQVSLTSEVDNYPGFPEGPGGTELVQAFQSHAERFGAKMQIDTVTAVDFSQRPFRLTGYSGDYLARAAIIATGASPRKLGVPGEEDFTGRGVSYCATCDGWFFKDRDIVVVGGGDSALEESLFLTRFASSVTIVHRRDELRAGPHMQARAGANPKISFRYNAVVTEVKGGERVEAVTLEDKKTGERRDLTTDGVFIFIGHVPNTGLFKDILDLDERGYLIVDRQMRTSVEGVFAAGEVADPTFRQVITSAGMGAAAAMMAQRWLEEQGGE
jgi:thioredoxin reductase (NADPH)